MFVYHEVYVLEGEMEKSWREEYDKREKESREYFLDMNNWRNFRSGDSQ